MSALYAVAINALRRSCEYWEMAHTAQDADRGELARAYSRIALDAYMDAAAAAHDLGEDWQDQILAMEAEL